jgi:hypothetical protein
LTNEREKGSSEGTPSSDHRHLDRRDRGRGIRHVARPLHLDCVQGAPSHEHCQYECNHHHPHMHHARATGEGVGWQSTPQQTPGPRTVSDRGTKVRGLRPMRGSTRYPADRRCPPDQPLGPLGSDQARIRNVGDGCHDGCHPQASGNGGFRGNTRMSSRGDAT